MRLFKTPWPTLLLLGCGVFLLFGTIGFANDVMQFGRQPTLRLWLSVVLYGVFAIFYAIAGFTLHRVWWKMLAVMFGIWIVQATSLTFLMNHLPGLPLPTQMDASQIAELRGRLNSSAGISVLTMVLAYACFVLFTITEGRRRMRVQTEIDLAAEVHRTLVPVIDTQVRGFEFYGRSLPSGEVGGDLIDVFQDDRGWIAYVADVSGHGVAPGVVMGMVKSAARMRLSSGDGTTHLLESLNSVLCSVTRPEMFATFAYLASGGGKLECSLAGHPAIVHYSASSKSISEITCSNMPLGMFDGQSFATLSVNCAQGDVFLLLTDGVLEVENAKGQEFGLDGVKRIVSEHAAESLPAIFQALVDAANRHGGRATDDQSLLILRSQVSS